MRIAVVGAGRVGVPTAASLGRLGHRVAVTDVDARRIETLQAGTVPFHEPGLEELVREGQASGRLRFTDDLADALDGPEAAFLCVGTPSDPEGAADLSALQSAADAVAMIAAGPLVLAVKSTVPVGTADRLADRLGPATRVVANPEFLREGRAVEDALRPLRVIVGTEDPAARELMRHIYDPLIDDGTPYIETDPRTAEVAKHACNAFLAMKVSYVNALARVCELAGADVETVTAAMAADDRIGAAYLEAGLGFGGYCLPKDLRAFERAVAALGYDFGLLREVDRVNDEAVDAAFARIESALDGVSGKRVALLGLAFKPGTDNVTTSPALALARRLASAGATVSGFDPQAGANAKAEVPEVDLAGDPYAALERADCAVLCTEWEEFRELDPARMRDVMALPVVVDGRNALDGDALTRAGFRYMRMGAAP